MMRGNQVEITHLGEGKPLVILPGGPGLRADYLLPWLSPLATDRRLLFVHPAVPLEAENTLRSLLKGVATRVQVALDGERDYDLFAHSFGCFMALQLLSAPFMLQPQRLILSNPFPLTWQRFLAVNERMKQWLRQRLSAEELQRMRMLDTRGGETEADTAYLRLIRPLYVHKPADIAKLDFGVYDRVGARRVMEAAADFDLLPQVAQLTLPLHLLLGAEDFFASEEVSELCARATTLKRFENVGHSPFLEANAAFLAHLRDL